MNERAELWLELAKRDLAWAEDPQDTGHFHGACFVAQQAAEKALKALAFFRGADAVRSHSLVLIAKELGENGDLAAAAMLLDPFYIPTRYPDAPPGAMPADSYGLEQSTEAISAAWMVFNRVEAEFRR